MGQPKTNHVGLHFWTLVVIAIATIPLQMSLLMYLPCKNNVMPELIAVLAIIIGYFRPFLHHWIRWLTIVGVALLFSLFFYKVEVSLAWCSMLVCMFSFSVAIRRIVMQCTGITRVADKSMLRELYNAIDEAYQGVADSINKNIPHANAKELVPVAHASAAMAISLLLLYIYTLGNHQQMAEWGFYLYIGYVVLVPIIYAIIAAPSIGAFPYYLVSSFAMAIGGILVMIICIIVVVIAIATVVAIVNAISNLFHKLFGRNDK